MPKKKDLNQLAARIAKKATEQEHTPGPWIKGKDFHNDLSVWTIRAKLTGKLIAEVPDVDGADEKEADLIAAAPDLLAALEMMQRALEETMPGVRHIACQDYAILNDAPLAASAAILKAKGGK